MVSHLKVALPHISLSRNNSPSRSNPTSPAPSTPATNPTGQHPLASDVAATSDSVPLDKDLRSRRASLGALGAVLRRSASTMDPSRIVQPTTTMTPASGTPVTHRPTSDGNGGIPLRSHLSSLVGAAGVKQRSQSSDRRAPPHPAGVPLVQSNSQPPLTRKSGGKHSPTLTPGTMTPVLGGGGIVGGAPRVPSGGLALGRLEESFVDKVSLRLGEAVNKVFMPRGPGPAELVWQGRTAPRVVRAKEFGELVLHELSAAMHDNYLLRTLLRSSVLKSLSLFLTRLTSLLIPVDTIGPPPLSPKDADNLSPALRFNLQIVRCAYEVKTALQAARRLPDAPHIVAEVLHPWINQLTELMMRVMNPLTTSVRIAISLICGKARIAEAPAMQPSQSVGGGSASATAMTGRSAPLRAASLGHAWTPTAHGAHAETLTGGMANGGPGWLKELNAVLEGSAKWIGRLECGVDGDKWLVSIGTHAVWKGMLNLSSRRILEEEVVGGASTTLPSSMATPSVVSTHSSITSNALGLFTKSANHSPPRGNSPPLHPVDAAPSTHKGSAPSPCDIAFIRLLCELELLQARLEVFVNAALPSSEPFSTNSSHGPSPALSACGCGLCKTGRTFDDDSSSDDEEDEKDGSHSPDGGRTLVRHTMKDAMQALSALVIMVRASRNVETMRQALEVELMDQQVGKTITSAPPAASLVNENTPPSSELSPLKPVDLLSLSGAPHLAIPTPPPSPPTDPSPAATSTTPSIVVCPTLSSALDTLPPLILLHLLASRVPTLLFPHELWSIDWRTYEKELRGFQAGEEWTPEIAWEFGSEVKKVLRGEKAVGVKEMGRKRAEVLDLAVRVVAGDEED